MEGEEEGGVTGPIIGQSPKFDTTVPFLKKVQTIGWFKTFQNAKSLVRMRKQGNMRRAVTNWPLSGNGLYHD